MTQTTLSDPSQNEFPGQAKSKTRKIYFAVLGLICVTTLVTICFYAYLVPLHDDEAGYWFNYTHKDFSNRNVPNNQVPNHTFTIYGAKLSLKLFGYNGIGYRFPVVFFSLLSSVAIFVLARRFVKSNFKASLTVGLLCLSPWYIHYSHELRGYPSFLFFVLITFILLDRILTEGDKPALWILMLGSFIGCYYSSMGAVVFIFNFMATLWVLKVAQLLMPKNQQLVAFQAISFKSFLIFSVVATAIMAFILFNLDLFWILQNRKYQFINHSSWDWTWVIKLAADIFSTFLGYRYLDDPTSVLYNYPLPVWIFSLICFFYGLKLAFVSRQTPALIFVVLYLISILFNVANQHYIQTRALCYLLPFLLIFQGMGLIGLIEAGINQTMVINQRKEAIYGTVGGILLIYFLMHTVGKYQSLEVKSGNPYQQVKSFLINNTGPTDLIISSLRDTVGGFYLGGMIRENNFNIYQNGSVENIYYLSSKAEESKIELDRVYPAALKVEFLPMEKFDRVASFVNKGVRSSEVHIYKRKLDINFVFEFNLQALSESGYFGNNGKVCNVNLGAQGIRFKCDRAPISCAKQVLNFAGVTNDDLQFVLFYHVNDTGTKTVTYASMKSMDLSMSKGKTREQIKPFPDVYLLNPLVNSIDDLDTFRENVELVDITLQKMGNGENTLLCMVGNLFENNSLIKGIKVFNWKQ